MAFFLPQRWRRQPQYPVVLNYGHPSAASLVYASLFSVSRTFNAVRTYPGVEVATPTTQIEDRGYSIGFNGSSSGLRVNNIPHLDNFTWLGRVYIGATLSDATLYGPIAARHTQSGSASDWYLYRGYLSPPSGTTTSLRVDIPWVAADVVIGNSYAANQWLNIAVTRSGSTGSWTYTTYVNGYQDGQGTTASNPNTSGHPFTIGCFGVTGANQQFENNRYLYSYLANRAFAADEVAELTVNPWQLFAPQRRVLYFGGAAAAQYSLPVDKGTFTLTGNATALTKQWVLTTSSGSFTYTGKDVAFTQGKVISSGVGTFTLTGNTTNLTKQWILSCSTGSFTYTGNDVAFTYPGGGWSPLAASKGTFTFTGNDVAVTKQWKITADAGSFTLTGIAAILKRGNLIVAASGSFTETGQDVALTKQSVLVCEKGTFIMTGRTCNLIWSGAPGVPVTTWSGVSKMSNWEERSGVSEHSHDISGGPTVYTVTETSAVSSDKKDSVTYVGYEHS